MSDATCTCPPGACHGGHTVDFGMPRLTDKQLRTGIQLCANGQPGTAADMVPDTGALFTELLALRARVTELEAAQREPIGYAAEQHRLRMLAFVEDMTHRADVPHPLREHAINLLREVTE